VVDVVEHPHAHPARGGRDESATHPLGLGVVQAQVVEREVERLARAVEEGADVFRDRQRRLAPVAERAELDHQVGVCPARTACL
jgi:hypothetical protein